LGAEVMFAMSAEVVTVPGVGCWELVDETPGGVCTFPASGCDRGTVTATFCGEDTLIFPIGGEINGEINGEIGGSEIGSDEIGGEEIDGEGIGGEENEIGGEERSNRSAATESSFFQGMFLEVNSS
jgi:hypothetical protein